MRAETGEGAAPAEDLRVLLVTSNGAGMGHLTRMLAVARATPGASMVILSLSLALPVVDREGVPGEYCPGPDRGPVTGPLWDNYLCERLLALVKETRAQVVAFDGVAPYRGVLSARRRLPSVPFVWVRRGMWRPGVNGTQIEKAAGFDLVVEPGDLASRADRGHTAGRGDAVPVPPVSMLEVVEPLPRDEAARDLGLDPDRPTVLVTLGSGRLGDVEAPGRVVVSTLLQDPRWQIVVTRAAIANREVPVVDRDRVVERGDIYPLVRYLGAFDAAVSAAGYNAVHEFLLAGVPTLLIPNLAARTDDQLARAEQLAAEGLALAAHPERADDLVVGVRSLMEEDTREALRVKLEQVPFDRANGGAATIGRILVAQAQNPSLEQDRLRFLLVRAKVSVKDRLKWLLGPRLSNGVRRVLGRPTVGPHGSAVPLVDSPLLTDEDPTEALRTDSAVEHLLRGSSPDYRADRQRIIDRYYA